MQYFVIWHERVKMTGGVQGLKENVSIHGTIEQAEDKYEEIHEAMLGQRGKLKMVCPTIEGSINDIHIVIPIKSTLYRTLTKLDGLEGDPIIFVKQDYKKETSNV